MKNILFLSLFFYSKSLIAQPSDNKACDISFYLLKVVKPSIDTSDKIRGVFSIEKNDLQEKAFISNAELLQYTYHIDTIRKGDDIQVLHKHSFIVVPAVIARIDSLNIPLCCGRQFVIKVNDEIIYPGYFWNIYSSFGCKATTAFASGNSISLHQISQGLSAVGNNDVRNNPTLLDCLKKTRRFRED